LDNDGERVTIEEFAADICRDLVSAKVFNLVGIHLTTS
jgi:hypothetical protein